MKTQEVVAKLPEHIRKTLDDYRKDYTTADNGSCRKDAARRGLAGYVKGLRDAGLISERERQTLFVYGTFSFNNRA